MNVCERNECQTSAGCGHRGPRGEYCHFASGGGHHVHAIPISSYQLLDGVAVAEVQYLKAVERHFVSYLAARYKSGEAVDIARLCDEKLDVSGRLLGRVRDVARGIKGWEPVDVVGTPTHD